MLRRPEGTGKQLAYPLKTQKELTATQRKTFLNALDAFERGKYSFAASLLGPLVSDEPEFFDGRKLLRSSQIKGSNGKSAFVSGLSLVRGKAVRRLIESGDFKAALAEAEKVLAQDPTGELPNRELHEAAEATAASARTKLAALHEALRSATDEQKQDITEQTQATHDEVRTYELIARFPFQTLAQADPKNVKARHDLGDYVFRLEEYEEAAEVYRDILKVDPRDAQAGDKLKKAEARRVLSRMDEPTKEMEQDSRGKTVSFGETIETLDRQVRATLEGGAPDLEKTRKLADLYFKEGDFASASAWYEYLSECAGHTDAGLLDLARRSRARQFEVEISALRESLKELQPGDKLAEDLQLKIAKLEHDKADWVRADARKRVERNPTDLRHRLDLGKCLVEAGHLKEAIPELQRAADHPSAHVDAMILLARCFQEMKMFDLAIGILTETEQQIPEMNTSKKEALYNLGIVHQLNGNPDESLECMKRIYKRDCNYRDVAARVEASYTA